MFEQVATKLLEGAFICESTAPGPFRWLKDGGQEEMAAYLDKIGRRLAKTPRDLAYYTTWKRIGQDERAEVRRTFSTIKQTMRPLIQFLTMCMEVQKSDSAPAPGDRVDYHPLLKAVTENSHLYETLREFATMGKEYAATDASAKGMLDKVMHQMKALGYLVLLNPEQESYRFTGKLDYYYQVIEFLMENEKIATAEPQEREDDDAQGSLV